MPTPIASRLIRNALDRGDEAAALELVGYQWFECSAIAGMAVFAANENIKARIFNVSESAFLPAPKTWLEWANDAGERWACAAVAAGAAIRLTFRCRDASGTLKRYPVTLTITPGSDQRLVGPDGGQEEGRWSALVEQMLCIINQPGLIRRDSRPAHKQVAKAAARFYGGETHWVEVRVKPGHHGKAPASDGSGSRMPLHYVRKHRKPSLDKTVNGLLVRAYIDGFWRGDRDVGLRLKSQYVVEAPTTRLAA